MGNKINGLFQQMIPIQNFGKRAGRIQQGVLVPIHLQNLRGQLVLQSGVMIQRRQNRLTQIQNILRHLLIRLVHQRQAARC